MTKNRQQKAKFTLPVVVTAVVLAFPIGSQAAPLLSSHPKDCARLMLKELNPILQLLQNQLSHQASISNINFTGSANRPFKAGSSVQCLKTTDTLTRFRCQGTMGSPCGIYSDKKFICKFLNSTGGEGFHANETASNTASALIPTRIECDICLSGFGSSTTTDMINFHQYHDASGKVTAINDPTGTACW